MPEQRTYAGGRVLLDVGGASVGVVTRFSGLAMEADVVTTDLGPDVVQKKHVSNIKWSPAKATIGIGMGKGMYEWIKAAFDTGFVTRDGAVVLADSSFKAQSRFNFTGGLITSVTVPKLDGSSKDAAYFDLEWECETVRWEKGGGEDVRGKIGSRPKAWLCSNFRVEMGSLPCARVATVDSFTWKCAVPSDPGGIPREPMRHPAKVTVPDIKLGISMADYPAWADAAKKWFVDGEHEEEHEMSGRIVFLYPDLKTEIGDIELGHVGFKKFSSNDMDANSEKIARFSVEFYCETMKFNMK